LKNLTSSTLGEGMPEFCSEIFRATPGPDLAPAEPCQVSPASAPRFVPGPLGHPLRPGEFTTAADDGGEPAASHARGVAFVHYWTCVKCLWLTSAGLGSHEAAALIPSGGLGWDPR